MEPGIFLVHCVCPDWASLFVKFGENGDPRIHCRAGTYKDFFIKLISPF